LAEGSFITFHPSVLGGCAPRYPGKHPPFKEGTNTEPVKNNPALLGNMADETDLKLIGLLEKNARISEKDIADMLGIGEADAKGRIDALQKEGILLGFHTTVNWEKLGKKPVEAIIRVKVVPEGKVGFRRMGEQISNFELAEHVYLITGEYDFMVKLKATSMDEVSNFVTEKLAPLKGVIGTYTHILLDKHKENGVSLKKEEKPKREIVSA